MPKQQNIKKPAFFKEREIDWLDEERGMGY
jgi:hypothetical protein